MIGSDAMVIQTRDVTGYGEPLRDIVLPNEGVRQGANRTHSLPIENNERQSETHVRRSGHIFR